MKIRESAFPQILLSVVTLFVIATATGAQQPAPQPAASRFDITNYRIEAQIIPDQHVLRAGADITVVPAEATRSLVFELNGSLKVESIDVGGKPLTGFVQDAVGVGALGPSVRVDLGQVMPANQPLTLRFRWSGALQSPEGGPLATKRLAYVGPEGSYLMYASRWFPFHDYAADRATSDITLIVPTGLQVAGTSDDAVAPVASPKDGATRFHFVHRQPELIGNFAAGQYINRNLRFGNYEIQFYAKPGSEGRINSYAEMMGQVLEFYSKQYGAPLFGTRLVVAQVDDDSLETYSGPGIIFLAAKLFDSSRPVPEERLAREVAYQWWGQTVGLKSFDDAWISQGLAEWSAFAFRESKLTGGALEGIQREEQERALTFEQTASIARAPNALDDQSAAYQSIIFHKGAMVFRMLRENMGKDKFDRLLHNFLEEYRGKNASIDDFEKLASKVAVENLRYFFAQWIEGTGVPEFSVDYQIIRTRSGKFRTRGTVKQTLDTLRMPVQLMLRTEGDTQTTTTRIEGKSEDFDFESNGQPLEVVVDPNFRILRMSDELRVSIVARRGIEQMKEGLYSEAQQQFEAALKLDRSNSWVYYNLGLLYLEQRNWQPALDNFDAALAGTLQPSWIEAWAHIKKGNAYDAKGERNRAVAEYNKAVQLDIKYDNAPAVAKKFLATPFDPKAIQSAELNAPGN
ncbi:MAG TPA: M1 family aminopeptidase [Pyrinomonadaceae bacterium]|jgi:tetratricopeptide (TPR) repeat protein|nr:M1 family aminopeptidase [Pyrinomonadaceae bacterium]